MGKFNFKNYDRKNKVDDLLTRFERKSAKQNQKCPYCHNEIG